MFAFCFGFAATLSTSALKVFVQAIPQWLISGLTVAGGLLPAVGFALIMSTMAKKEYIPALILGYVCVAYLKMPVIGLAFAGAVLAFNNYYNGRRADKNKGGSTSTNDLGSDGDEGVLKMASSRKPVLTKKIT